MRRSGSSSCMLRPKSDLNLSQAAEEPLSVTLINKQPLPLYSSERFYMLSELEMNCHSTLFLCDHAEDEQHAGECDDTQDTIESSEASLLDTPIPPVPLDTSSLSKSPFVILYILWNTQAGTSSVQEFIRGPIRKSLTQIGLYLDGAQPRSASSTNAMGPAAPQSWHSDSNYGSTYLSTTSIYLVVDTLVPMKLTDLNTSPASPNSWQRQQRFQTHMDIAENLARHVSQEQDLRSAIEGITVGVSDHERAAPGLEACLDAVSAGAKVRRKHSKSEASRKSLLQIVCPSPDDLLGVQSEHVTDAVQGVLQNRTIAEWNGLGDIASFARRAHAGWCERHEVLDDEREKNTSSTGRRRPSRRSPLDDLERGGLPIGASMVVNMMMTLVLIHVGLSLWNIYGDMLITWYESIRGDQSQLSTMSTNRQLESAGDEP